MSTSIKPCARGCNPCVCLRVPGTDVGCLPVSCVPRPCFFDGQLIGADDLNAIVAYFRNRDTVTSRFLGGWGILAGLKLDAPLNAVNLGRAQHLATGAMAQLSPNPQILAGTTVTVSPGVAIDALGRTLIVCEPVALNLQDLAQTAQGGTALQGSCSELIGPYCSEPDGDLAGIEYYLVATLVETPSRPAPKFSGGAPCDPAPSCDFSRKLEQVEFKLVGSVPDSYQYSGCLDPVTFTLPNVDVGTAGDTCADEVLALIDYAQTQLAMVCCARPVIVLGKVLVTPDPGSIAEDLPSVPLYTVIMDGYPQRKLTLQASFFSQLFPDLVCGQSGGGGTSGT